MLDCPHTDYHNAYREEVCKELDEMLASGVIEQSTSEWSAPIVPVREKDGSLRHLSITLSL